MLRPTSKISEDERPTEAAGLDDQLYGQLLEVNAALTDAGGALIFAYALILLGTYLTLWFEFYEAVWFLRGADLNVVWVYLVALVVVCFVWIAHFEFLQWWCYRRNRRALLDSVRRAALSRYELLARIAHDKAVATVAAALQRDRWDGADEFYVARAR